jgi:hypothetical protein
MVGFEGGCSVAVSAASGTGRAGRQSVELRREERKAGRDWHMISVVGYDWKVRT